LNLDLRVLGFTTSYGDFGVVGFTTSYGDFGAAEELLGF
jgi:hypothetical protein